MSKILTAQVSAFAIPCRLKKPALLIRLLDAANQEISVKRVSQNGIAHCACFNRFFRACMVWRENHGAGGSIDEGGIEDMLHTCCFRRFHGICLLTKACTNAIKR